MVRAPLLVLAGLGLTACGCEAPAPAVESGPPPMDAPAAEPVGERARILGAFLAEHWRLPVPPQGPAPDGWSEAEASLDPATCGACHPRQFAEWRTSLHAGAWSPGLAGQLVEGPLAAEGQRHACMTCHTPLTEQQTDAPLRAQGLVCAGCHVRAHTRFGPPRRAAAAPPPEPVPHGGFVARPEYQEARFCAQCHQFWDDRGVAGKPIQNTYFEWAASPHAAEGRTCQQCHMPDRAHLWRGIHDPETVRTAVDAELVPAGDGLAGPDLEAALRVRNTNVGHAFPTYITPRVLLAVWQEDAEGRELPGTREEGQIARVLSAGFAEEVSDTRVPPGETFELSYARPRAPGAAALAARITVDPDHFYRGVFASLLESYEDPEAVRLVTEAHRRTLESGYDLYAFRLEL